MFRFMQDTDFLFILQASCENIVQVRFEFHIVGFMIDR
jgi:hypothetical protein